MKPIEFMDALSDVNEKYVREMLDGSEVLPAHGKVKGALNMQLPVQTGTKSISQNTSGTDKPFGGKLRYLAVLASAAACLAGVVGIMNMRPGNSENMVAESLEEEIRIAECTTVTGQTTDAAEEGAVTTCTSVKEHVVTVIGTETAVQTTATGETGSTQQTEAVTTAKQPNVTTMYTTEPAEHTTLSYSTYVVDSYEQSELLGDVDADGDITLVDYLLAAREWSKYLDYAAKIQPHVIDEPAVDRADVVRLRKIVRGSSGRLEADPRIDENDVYAIRDVALIRAYLGGTNVKCEDYVAISESGDYISQFGIPAYDDALYKLCFGTDEKNSLYPGWGRCRPLRGEQIPKELRDFFEDLYSYYPDDTMIHCNVWDWTDEEFNAKLSELRTILAKN